jgi:hypothetical protein
MSKPRLVVLSDLYGNSNEPWMEAYRNALNAQFTVVEYDCRELAEIAHLNPDELHHAFTNGGIQRAVSNLRVAEPTEIWLLGFSVGGTIAWKFALESASRALFAVSATRLRYETKAPSCRKTLYFGELEEFGPQNQWFNSMYIQPVVIPNQGHECYKNSNAIGLICDQIITALNDYPSF